MLNSAIQTPRFRLIVNKGSLKHAKLKATGKWAPRYTTTEAFIATVKAFE